MKVRQFLLLSLAGLALGALTWHEMPAFAKEKPTRFGGPTSSQPLALTADGEFLLVVNPDNDTVSIFDVKNDKNRRVAEVSVGTEPNGVAVLPGGGLA